MGVAKIEEQPHCWMLGSKPTYYKCSETPPPMADCGMVAKWQPILVRSWIVPLAASKAGSTSNNWDGVCGLRAPNIKTQTPKNRKNGKKNLHQTVAQVKAEHPDADVELWCEDEHRIGLNPVTRRVWVEPGEQPTATVNWKRQWLWLYGFVEPKTGETYWWILPYVRTDLFSEVLKDFAQHFGVGKSKRIVLPLDRAGWHLSPDLKVPEGIHLVLMPSYSPELQPAERLWPLINEPLANQAFESIAEVEALVYQRCQRLFQHTELIRGLTSFHWWPEITPNKAT
jgi:transposase